MTVSQAARELEMAEHDVRALCSSKVLRARKGGRGSGWQIPRREVARLKRNLARRQMIPERGGDGEKSEPGADRNPGL